MENKKIMSKWKKWNIGTIVAMILAVLYGLIRPDAGGDGGLEEIMDITVVPFGVIAIVWFIFSLNLATLKNKPFLVSGIEAKKQASNAIRNGFGFFMFLIVIWLLIRLISFF